MHHGLWPAPMCDERSLGFGHIIHAITARLLLAMKTKAAQRSLRGVQGGVIEESRPKFEVACQGEILPHLRACFFP